jgi:hypothetical protein
MSRTKDLKSIAGLARQAKMNYVHLCDILKGRRNACLENAMNLGFLTKTDPRIWGRGGTMKARRAAFEVWREAQDAAETSHITAPQKPAIDGPSCAVGP